MGAFFNEELSFPPVHANFASSQEQLIRFSKNVHDNVHGNIYLDPLALKFIDTEQFQRLRDLKQLGVTHLVYPGAVHSRFEHSLGVYWLAGAAIQKLKQNQGLELGIDNFDIQTVKLAGLLHDVGHGPFSHLFEREFLPRVVSGCKWSHEQMSLKMVDHIVDEHHIDVDFEMIKKVKEMIVASSELTLPKGTREKHFLYDIVANGRNGIDVDKFDYIVRDSRACGLGCNFEFQRLMETMRVLDDEICYRAKEYLTVHKLFYTRADLYRTIYTHPKVKAIELMVVDALLKANDFLEISSSIEDPSDYWKLDDSIIKTIEIAPNQELKESRDLILRIRRRNLYQFCNEYTVPKENLEHFKDVTPQDIVCSQKNGGAILKEEDVAVSNVRIDLARGRHNPLERYLKKNRGISTWFKWVISFSIYNFHFSLQPLIFCFYYLFLFFPGSCLLPALTFSR
ncbi:HD domain-containing protein [Citrus sinensis]|uniref:HD domain-containing protein n=1 Tax=Citrus sinensis TaxID=2711 RepID=A0ACB8MYU9_CITSI|nr:HD domain-containing protein [Citrus sinensis]